MKQFRYNNMQLKLKQENKLSVLVASLFVIPLAILALRAFLRKTKSTVNISMFNSQENVIQNVSGYNVPGKNKAKLFSYSQKMQQEMKELDEKYGQLKTQYKDKSDKLKVFMDKNTAIKNDLVQRKLLIKEMEKMQLNEEDINKSQRAKVDELKSELVHMRKKQISDLDNYEQSVSKLAERLQTSPVQYEEPSLLRSVTELNEELKKREAEVCKCLSDLDTARNSFHFEVHSTDDLIKDLNYAINVIDGKTNEINEDIKKLRSELKSYTKVMNDLNEEIEYLNKN